jgi:hypothetical protein
LQLGDTDVQRHVQGSPLGRRQVGRNRDDRQIGRAVVGPVLAEAKADMGDGVLPAPGLDPQQILVVRGVEVFGPSHVPDQTQDELAPAFMRRDPIDFAAYSNSFAHGLPRIARRFIRIARGVRGRLVRRGALC